MSADRASGGFRLLLFLVCLGLVGSLLAVLSEEIGRRDRAGGFTNAVEEVGSARLLRYRWSGYPSRRIHEIAGRVAESDLEAAVKEFGWTRRARDAALQRAVRAAIRSAGGEMVGETSSQWSYRCPPGAKGRVQAAIRRAEDETLLSFYKERGFVLDARTRVVGVDYARAQERNMVRTAELARALVDLARSDGADAAGLLRLALSLVQRFRFEIPPDRDGEREILGFWTPPEVAVRAAGDCDSKSIFFASLWSAVRPGEVIAVETPEHLFLGVKGLHARSAADMVLRVGGVDYLLCETTSYGWGPGQIDEEQKEHIREGRSRVIRLR